MFTNKYIPPHLREKNLNNILSSNDKKIVTDGQNTQNKYSSDNNKLDTTKNKLNAAHVTYIPINKQSKRIPTNNCANDVHKIDLINNTEVVDETEPNINHKEEIEPKLKFMHKEENDEIMKRNINLSCMMVMTMKKHIAKEEADEFIRWKMRYGKYLKEMYDLYIDGNINIRYEEFVDVAYRTCD